MIHLINWAASSLENRKELHQGIEEEGPLKVGKGQKKEILAKVPEKYALLRDTASSMGWLIPLVLTRYSSLLVKGYNSGGSQDQLG